jgi:hypothetical protein
MKNTGYLIHLTTKLGRTTSYVKDDDGWTQICQPVWLAPKSRQSSCCRTYCRHSQATSRASASE